MFDLKLNSKFRHILHVDADAFFASVHQALDPNLKNKAIIVGGKNSKKGIVCTASYEAKNQGVKTAMPIFKALKICPEAICIDSNFKAYTEYSIKLYNILRSYSKYIEMTSIDEAYLDLSFDANNAHKIARDILHEVKDKLNITVSCGYASNKTVAKVASAYRKPNQITIVPFLAEKEFLSKLEINALPGIGKKTSEVLRIYGISHLGQISSLSFEELISKFGISMVPIWKKAHGIDNSTVNYKYRNLKSISNEKTFYQTPLYDDCLNMFQRLSKKVFRRLDGSGLHGNKIFVKIRYKNGNNKNNEMRFEDRSFQSKLYCSSNSYDELYPLLKSLFLKHIDFNKEIRLIGVGVGDLRKTFNLNLF